MSTIKHRQPIVNWSSVVLLSTLLLSPMTAASMLHILAQAFPHAFAAAASEDAADLPVLLADAYMEKAAPAPADQTLAAPRRANSQRQVLRRASAGVSRPRDLRAWLTTPSFASACTRIIGPTPPRAPPAT